LFQALCGWEVVGAGEDNPPMWHRFGFMDHQCALASVVATLIALRERDRTGEGQVVAASLLGAGVLTTSESYRQADGTLAPMPLLDGDQTGIAPDRCIRPAGDGWIAIAGDEAEDVRLAQRDPFLDDSANRAAGLVASYPHAEWGRLEQPGALWWFGDMDVRLSLAPPVLGQHTRDILTEVGFSAEDIDALVEAGAAL
jgi:crotonobetainyl-CoA:carnitine CoA-transferase CaiB-like acyl-CoA transferase